MGGGSKITKNRLCDGPFRDLHKPSWGREGQQKTYFCLELGWGCSPKAYMFTLTKMGLKMY